MAVPPELRRFIQLASESESCRPLVNAVWRDLHRPLAVVDRRGSSVAVAPLDGGGTQALALASRFAQGLTAQLPSDWTARRLVYDRSTLGWMVIGRRDSLSPPDDELLDALCGLVSGQLGRATLRQTILAERQAALRHRLVMDAGVDPAAARAEAHSLELRLADLLWPSIVFCGRGEVAADTLGGIAHAWEEQAPAGSFSVPWDDAVVLLYADDAAGGVPRGDVERVVRHTLRIAGAQRPSLDARAIVGEVSVPIDRVHGQLCLLRRLRRYSMRTTEARPVMRVRDFALDRLLEQVNGPSRQSFVEQCVGKVIAYDKQHGSTLTETLELALEYPRRDDAARAAYMHRNTFRRRLQQALDLVDADLDDCDQRLAVHVALRLHRLSSGFPRSSCT